MLPTRFFLSGLLVLLLALGCQRDTDGTRLLTLPYPVTEPLILAGSPGFATAVIAQPSLANEFPGALDDAGIPFDDVDLVGGFAARLVSLTGDDFREIDRVELRACPVGQSGGCNQFDIVFSQGDLFNRRQQVINLSPSLRNLRELFLGQERVRVELVITPGTTISRTLETRLEWSMQAVGDL